MEAPAVEFLNDRVEAAGRFVQTIIVVDDEAELAGLPDVVPTNIVRPSRSQSRAARETEAESHAARVVAAAAQPNLTHLLDAKALMDSSLEVGLVCSILRPGPEEDLRTRLKSAARRVDIVSLEWEIHGDNGNTTISLIQDIVEEDRKNEGRLRLIVIYTAERARVRILKAIRRQLLTSLSAQDKKRMNLKVDSGRELRSNIGLRIVCFIKPYDTGAPKRLTDDQVAESELPARILNEFASLSDGLVSNVALATLAAIRDSAHQIVGSFSGNADGPYFHHRATIPNPDEAEDFATNIVLDGLRSAVRLQEIGRRFAGRPAVERRLRHLASEGNTLRLLTEPGPNGAVCGIDFPVNHVVRIINDGLSKDVYNTIIVQGKPTFSNARRAITTFFVDDWADAQKAMKQFAVLTGIASHPGTHDIVSGDYVPSLGLGTVVLDKAAKYWLCIQASCDSVRVTEPQPFLFVPLEEISGEGRHTVPRVVGGSEINYVALAVGGRAYSRSRSIVFSPTSDTERVLASYGGKPSKLRFTSVNRIVLEWVADLKQYPALRVAQELGQEMGRLGYDEFEPFREK